MHVSDFLQRVITALFFGLALLLPIYLGPIMGSLIIGALCLLTVLEYLKIQNLEGRSLLISTSLAMAMYFGLVWLIIDRGITVPVKYAIFLSIIFGILLLLRFSQKKDPFIFTFQVVPATLYIAVPLSLLLAIAQWEGFYRPGIILAILLFVWVNDTMAYLFGRTYGKKPFSPAISPNKTWEGTIAGWVCSLITAIILWKIMGGFNWWQWIILAAVMSIAGSYGDLIESLFKRKKNIKDTGVFLPGHGGMLDRLDSLLFSLPFAALLFLLWS